MSETHRTNIAAIRDSLSRRDFRHLFREHLGWDNDSGKLSVSVADKTFTLTAIAQKRGFRILHCPQIPDRTTRIKIDNKLTATAYEHMIIFTDDKQQIWQWTRRQVGRPAASRSFTVAPDQSGEALAQKLAAISFSLDEEESLNIATVAGRASAAFDVEKVTKRFYEQFKAEHAALLTFIKGIAEAGDLKWYGSLMLNRLMFVYFIQKKGFLDNDVDYLRNRLNLLQQRQGKDKFHSFYRYFLLRLFHDGLAKAPAQRDARMEKLLGKVPYLNGGFFEVHELEQRYPEIDIPDEAFEKLFDFFDKYRWHLDERPLRADNEINPDVVGYIFEKYINQKQMGAYYTKEDITEYISKNTLIPFLFDSAKKQCPIAFRPGSYLWRLLKDDPDRYIYPAVLKGVVHADGATVPEQELPDFVQAGMRDANARMFDKRYNLGQAPKDDPLRLPTETWREYVARRTRCLEIREKLRAGEVHEINDLITLNLDIWRFARDAVSMCEGPELLRAFWNAIRGITVLDPTCGSGAFLFAALRILETLYEDCLGRMEGFLSEVAPMGQPEKFTDFRSVLSQTAAHPSETYFILKSIIINNLFGVDIMPEAVEICKLRLFLKLAAQAETFEQIEPLPDIDFNIRAGNTLVGYATLESLRKGQEGKLLFSANELRDIERSASGAARIFSQFKELQIPSSSGARNPPQCPSEPRGLSPRADSELIAETKTAMRQALAKLADRLDRYLAGEYGIDVQNKPKEFEKWKSSHQPFHWFTEFYGVMSQGGFDVIIGNPPYVEYRRAKDSYNILDATYHTASAENLYAFCVERSAFLLHPGGRLGMIIPSSAVGLDETACLRGVLAKRFGTLWYSTYAIRPAKLFDGVDQRLCIALGDGGPRGPRLLFTTQYHHWCAEERSSLFPTLTYLTSCVHSRLNRIAQLGEPPALGLLSKIEKRADKDAQSNYAAGHRGFIAHYHRSPRYWIRSMDFEQYFKSDTRSRSVHHFRDLAFHNEADGKCVCAVLNSSLFFFWFMSICNGRNLTAVDVGRFPVGQFDCATRPKLVGIFDRLMTDYKKNSIVRKREDCEFQEFRPNLSKPIIDEIDHVLAEHYGFTPEELDFIINYDIKYRMGAEAAED
jgi:hypothetical protein